MSSLKGSVSILLTRDPKYLKYLTLNEQAITIMTNLLLELTNIPLKYRAGQKRQAYRCYVQQTFLPNRYNHDIRILISTIH